MISSQDRWNGCLCYLSILVLVPIIFVRDKSPFLARHCQQGFALLFLQIVAMLILTVVDSTIGTIPVLGFLISLLLHLIILLAVLAVSVLGFVRALAGENWEIPHVDEIADKVPIQSQ
jgi:uncharacterized membrane protein